MEVLEWCDMPHSRFVLNSLHQMQKTNYMCDVVLLAANERISAHKLVLCAVSEYFRTLQHSNLKESINNEIQFGELSGNTLRQMIRFIYTGEIEINDSTVYDLMSASHLLQISILKLVISNYLVKSLNTNNCLEVLAYAKLYSYQELFCDTLKYIAENFLFVVTNSVFLQTPIDVVKYVFFQRNLNLKNMCRAFERWLNNNRSISVTPCIDESWKDYLKNVRGKLQDHNDKDSQVLELINKIENIIKENCRNEDCNVLKNNNLIEKEVILCVGGSSRGTIWSNIECLADMGWSLSYPPHSVLQEAQIDQSMYTAAIHPMKEPRMCSALVKFDNIDNDTSVIYIIGGLGTADAGAALKTCEKYDIRINKWSVLTPLPHAIKEGAAVICDDTLFFAGGVGNESDVFSEVWEYTEKDKQWKFGSKLQQARCCHGFSNVMGSLYVMGGRGAQGVILSSVERYNADLRTWSYVCEMPEAKCEFGCVTINEFIYVLGGATKFFVLNSVQRYNTITDKWEKCADMPVPKCGFGCTVKEDKIFCIGGSNIAHGPLPNVEVYNGNTNRWTYLQDRLLTERGYTCATTLKILVDPKIQNC